MTKKRPTSDKLANELLGASAFFRATPRPAADQPQEQKPVAPAVSPPATPESASPSDVTTSRRHSVTSSTVSPSPSAPAGFDLNRPTASRDSLRLSIDETKAIDELRQALKWDYDVSVSKNDICRAALHALLEKFAAKGDKSSAVNRLKRKQSSR